ncbi:ABC transporter ATP-binding protein [Clostridiaceae bacterium 35-E11]
MKNAIEIKNVRKVYKVGDQKVVALDDVSLEIKEGEVCCFLGTSGSGKSTLLNMMAGLEKPTKGSIEISGKRIEKMNEKKLALFRQEYIGFIFQSYNLLPALTALENVSLPLTFRGIKKAEREKIAEEILAAVGLKKYITHKPSQMSGGQQQRVGIARAFVSKPPIVFADEPTGNLDSKTTHEIMELMLEMARKYQQTLIIVTHDKSIAEYADKIVYILDGNIEKIEEKNLDIKENINEA